MVLSTSLWSTFGIFSGAFVADFGQRWFIKHLMKRSQAKAWLRSLAISSLTAPLTFTLWMFCILLALNAFPIDPLKSYLPLIQKFNLIIGFSWFGLRLINRIQEQLIQVGTKDKTTVDAASMIARSSVLVVATLLTLQILNFRLSGVLAFGGIGGIALGFAAKDLLANFFGAFMLYWDHPFRVGDFVTSPDKNIEGTVEHIGWRLTTIRSLDTSPVYIPNSLFSTIALVNISRITHRRIKEVIRVRFDDVDQINAMTEEIKQLLEHHPSIDSGQSLFVNLERFSQSAIDIVVCAFTYSTDYNEYLETKQEILLNIAHIINKRGAELAFPTSRVQLEPTNNQTVTLS